MTCSTHAVLLKGEEAREQGAVLVVQQPHLQVCVQNKGLEGGCGGGGV